MRKIQRKKMSVFVVLLLVVGLIVFFSYKYQKKSLLNQDEIRNEIFTEEFFEGLVQIQSATNTSSIDNRKDLEKICSILAQLTLKKSNYKSDVNYYGSYCYVLKYERGQEKRISLLGISEEKMLILCRQSLL